MGELHQHGRVEHAVGIDVTEGGGEQHQHRAHSFAAGIHQVPTRPPDHVVRCGHGFTQPLLDDSETLDDACRELLIDVGNARQRGRHGSPGDQRGAVNGAP